MTHDAPATPPIRVASVPSAHAYVEHLSVKSGSPRIRRLADPAPPGAPTGQWWPPVMLDAEWVERNSAEFDVMHVHFGAESFSTAHLELLVGALRGARKGLVYTVHDLENPQLVDQSIHEEHLGLLIGAADEVLTLTAGAAAEIERRWGRRADVVGHPHLLPLDAPAPLGTSRPELVIGVDLRDLRPNIDAERSVVALIDAIETLGAAGIPARGRVRMRERVRDAARAARVGDLIESSDGRVELTRADRVTDAELAEVIADLDISVLPYSHGTHSGWLELCWDLGVPVVSPPVGCFAEQHPGDCETFDPDAPGSLAAAVIRILETGPARPGTPARGAVVAARRELRREAAEHLDLAHHAAYSRAVRAGRAVVA